MTNPFNNLGGIHVSIFSRIQNYEENSMFQIHVTTSRNPCNNLDKAKLNKIQQEQTLIDGLTIQGNDWPWAR